ncbi:MAG: hypothetical protein ABI210_08405 [Abditibacteriaceae bacterium]
MIDYFPATLMGLEARGCIDKQIHMNVARCLHNKSTFAVPAHSKKIRHLGTSLAHFHPIEVSQRAIRK